MRGKGYRRAAEKAFKQWRKLRFDALVDSRLMPTPLHATLRLPIPAAPAHPSTPATSSPTATIDLHLSTNHPTVAEWWAAEYGPFLHARSGWKPSETSAGATNHAEANEAEARHASVPIVASTRVATHVGPPAAPLGYPPYLASEAQQWTAGVMRGEAYAYAHAAGSGGGAAPPPPAGSPYLAPVRWLEQPLLDGVVAQRLTAHTGVTTAALLDARRDGASLGRPLPPFDLSPFYATGDLLDRWCLFGEPSVLLPATAPASSAAEGGPSSPAKDDAAAAAHHRRVAELALAAAVLPNYDATWLNGAVVVNLQTGKCVLVVGPRRSGKTTLALHCVAASPAGSQSHPRLCLAAAEHFFLGAGTPVRHMLHQSSPPSASPLAFICALPHRVRVGIGAVLGTLRPNPALTAAAAPLPPFLRSDAGLRAFLANSDQAIWEMSLHYRVSLQRVCGSAPSTPPPWQPAGVHALAGVVLLDWEVAQLARTTPVPLHTRVRRLPLHAGGAAELVARGRDYLFRDHHLVRSVYADAAADGPARLTSFFAQEWAARPLAVDDATAPSLHCVEGSVDFDVATQLVQRLLTA
ncbi:hypothetical protein NQL31_000143 [Lotmaria passim]